MADPKEDITINFVGSCSCHTSKIFALQAERMQPFRKVFRQWTLTHCFPEEDVNFFWMAKKLSPDESPDNVGMTGRSIVSVVHNPDLTFGDVEIAVLLNKEATGMAEIYSALSKSGKKYVNLDELIVSTDRKPTL